MQINKHMDLYALAELMGTHATPEQAERMRDMLVRGAWAETKDVTEECWGRMLEEAA